MEDEKMTVPLLSFFERYARTKGELLPFFYKLSAETIKGPEVSCNKKWNSGWGLNLVF